MTKFKFEKNYPTPRSEQETIIIFNVDTNKWNFYTNYPKHARRWEDRIVLDKDGRNRKVFHQDSNLLIELQGEIEGSVSIRAPRNLTDQQREEIGKRLNKHLIKN